jgi:hypothetical protein
MNGVTVISRNRGDSNFVCSNPRGIDCRCEFTCPSGTYIIELGYWISSGYGGASGTQIFNRKTSEFIFEFFIDDYAPEPMDEYAWVLCA